MNVEHRMSNNEVEINQILILNAVFITAPYFHASPIPLAEWEKGWGTAWVIAFPLPTLACAGQVNAVPSFTNPLDIHIKKIIVFCKA